MNVERATKAAQWRRLRPALRHAAVDRHGPGRVSAPHRPKGQRMGRAGEWVRAEVQGEVPEEPTREEPGTQYYGLDDDDGVPELSGARLRWGSRGRRSVYSGTPSSRSSRLSCPSKFSIILCR